jgi:2-polyprenyl-6-hydroxyphenyl methylase/3-demethylubiquinone-9 3-methyltransferase
MLRKDIKRELDAGRGTADPEQIARFNALAEEWWKPNGAFKVVHAFNQARVTCLRERLPELCGRDPSSPEPLRGLRIVDVGCGAGIVTEALCGLGASVLGIDAAERNIAIAERHAELAAADVQYRLALPEDLADAAGAFDIVLSLEVIEHVADQAAFVGALARLVKPGGILVIGTINRTIRSFIKAIIGAEYVLRWLPRGTHDWRRFVTPRELDRHLQGHGLVQVDGVGVSFDFLRRRWHTLSNDSVTYLRFYSRPN